MMRTFTSLPRMLVAVALVMVLAACSGDGPTTTPTSTATPAASPAADSSAGSEAAAADAVQVAAACPTPTDAPTADIPGWPLMPGAPDAFMPMLASSLVTVGPSRLLFSLLDPSDQSPISTAAPTRIDIYALERDPEAAFASVEAAYLDTGLGHGLYRATLDFDCPGEWGAEVTTELADGSVATERLRFQVHLEGSTPGIGDPAPRSDSLTAATPEDVAAISTDPDPYPAAYSRTVAEVVSAGQPSLVFFATPAFCQTGTCGPTLEVVKSVAIEYEDRIGFVNVEPYQLHMTVNGLQPLLDADGRLQPVQAVLDYGLLVEPYLFVVDAAGDVFATFEGIVGADELRAAVEEVLAEAA